MLQRIDVDGFRSLRDFQLDLLPGLNVLVGPNGAGKSNVLRFFEFLCYLTRGRVAESVSKAGGAGDVFFRTASREISKIMRISVEGKTDIYDEDDYFAGKFDGSARYNCDFVVRIADDFTSIYFSYQRVRMHFTKDKSFKPLNSDLVDWDIDVESTASPTQASIKVNKMTRDNRFVDNDLDSVFKNEKSRNRCRENSLISILGYSINSLNYVESDLSAGKPFAIDPEKVREPEDIAQAATIHSDGRGLASTLFALDNGAEFIRIGRPPRQIFRRSRKNTRSKDILFNIKRYTQLINESVKDIRVSNDNFENKLKVHVTLATDHDDIEIPLSLLSDGTVKWLTLVTAITIGGVIFSLEEPENFLHPRMQIEIIDLIREATLRSNRPQFALLTTHSETILNCLNPEEIVVTKMELAKTRATRIEDVDAIKTEIRETGFGLGFFYVRGGL
jgi:predicted ATPase